jgi:large subunit ribosomal protein L28
MKLKREILIRLATDDYYHHDEEKHNYIREKYAEFVIPLEEAEWVGLELNEACRKQQDIEDNIAPVPLKHLFEKELLEELETKGDSKTQIEEYKPVYQKSRFAERLFGKFMKPLEDRVKL